MAAARNGAEMTTGHHRYAAMSGRQPFNRDALEAGYFADMGRLRRREAAGPFE